MFDCLNINFQFGPKYLILSAQTIQNKKGPKTGYKSECYLRILPTYISCRGLWFGLGESIFCDADKLEMLEKWELPPFSQML